MSSKILIPVDGSEAALDAARFAVRLAAGLGLEPVALWVVDVDHYASEFEAVRETVASELETNAEKILGQVRRIGEESGVSIQALVRHGDSSREIIRFVQETPEVALVVMGASGRRRLGRQMIGSTAERVVREAARDLPCPVIVVPCRASQRQAAAGAVA